MRNLSDGTYSTCAAQTASIPVDDKIGKSVEYALLPDVKYWFPIRATHHRAQKIYDKIVSLRNDCLEPYLPILRHIEYTNEDFNNPTQYIADKPLDTGLLFLRSTVNDFRALLQYDSMFPGMTPYYNHFYENEFGKNDFLTVPDRQMESFKIIVESGNENILVRQNEVPSLLSGDRVVLCGVVEIFVGVFDVSEDGQVGFEAVAAQRNYLVVNFLRPMVRGAYWKPILYVWQQGVLYRLPVFGLSSFGIIRNYAFRNGG